MSKKIGRAAHGPGMSEILLSVVLSIVLGVALGAMLLILRPVIVAKEMPKDPVKGAVYYIEGSKDSSKAKQALAKRKSFAEGQSISVTEDEINALFTPAAPAAPAPAPAKAGEKKSDKKDAGSDTGVALGAPNVRMDNGDFQFGVPIAVSLLGLDEKVIVQSHGGFVKKETGFVYEPSTIYFGSCPVQRLPFLSNFVRKKALESQGLPEDIKASWDKLANVAVEGKTLKLTMP